MNLEMHNDSFKLVGYTHSARRPRRPGFFIKRDGLTAHAKKLCGYSFMHDFTNKEQKINATENKRGSVTQTFTARLKTIG
jgi:hypothetical protein